jgi:hypothetical protein
MLGAAGCRRGLPAPLDTGPRPVQSDSTISGTVRGPEGTTPIDGRIIDIVNVATLDRQRIVTNEAGGFSVRLQPGDYRVELKLREGEALVRQPGVIHLNRSDADAQADFVIGTSRVSRPRPAYRVDDGLGSPVA